jgi:hypothetical protein
MMLQGLRMAEIVFIFALERGQASIAINGRTPECAG